MAVPSTATLANGVEVPRLAVGTHKVMGAAAEAVVQWALEAGYRHIDTASIYKNESEIGRAIGKSGLERSAVFVTSKLSPYEQGYEKALTACQQSLDRLGTSYLDLYLIHWPGVARKPPDSADHALVRMDTWRALEKLYEEGKCRAIGVSNFTVKHLQHMLPLCTVRPMVNQVEMHPLLSQSELRAFCHSQGILVAAYSPLGCGELLRNERVLKLSEEVACSPSQLLLSWSLHRGSIAIPKTSSKERLVENHASINTRLSEAQLGLLDGLDFGHHFCWDSGKVA